VRTRGSAGNYYVDLHIWVDPDMHVDKAHDISHDVIDSLKEKVDGVSDVVVHIEPGVMK
jgi:divalent metal cation (Fe/Co/Zn/Cd) transporter